VSAGLSAARGGGVDVAAVGIVTGWGTGTAALPDDAGAAAGRRAVVAIPRPDRPGERFRRVTRECLVGIAAVDAMLQEATLDRETLAGDATALVYVTAATYGASNREFTESAGRTLHFPYTAASAVPAEVAIEFGLRGPYVILVGGPAATVDALWQAATLLGRGACARALVLAVETFEECSDLYARGRWLRTAPLVEAGACALLVPGGRVAWYGRGAAASALEREARRRAGETLACAPLIGLALAGGAADALPVTGEWRGRRAALTLGARS
jgi:hypothetical protein